MRTKGKSTHYRSHSKCRKCPGCGMTLIRELFGKDSDYCRYCNVGNDRGIGFETKIRKAQQLARTALRGGAK